MFHLSILYQSSCQSYFQLYHTVIYDVNRLCSSAGLAQLLHVQATLMLAKETKPKTLLIIPMIVLLWVSNAMAAWQTINTPYAEINLKIIHVQDEDNLWLSGSEGQIYRLFQGNWEVLPTPTSSAHYILNYTILDTTLYVSAISRSNFSTIYFKYSHERWVLLDHQSLVPVRSMVADHVGGAWVFGDWGVLLHIVKDTMTPVATPIEQHIRSGYSPNPDSLWLGTRNYGVYLFTQQNGFAQFLDTSWVGHDVLGLYEGPEQSVLGVLDDGRVFMIRENEITSISEFTVPDILFQTMFHPSNGSVYGISQHRELFHLQEKGWVHLPTYPPRPLFNMSSNHEGQLFVGGEHGQLLKWEDNPSLQFHNIADILSIEGGSNSNTMGASLIDIDQDNDLDLFVFNSDRYQRSRLYRNHGGAQFSEISYEAGLLDLHDPVMYTVDDFDQEGSADLAFIVKSKSSYQLKILYQISKIPLLKHKRTLPNLPIQRDPVQLLTSDPDFDGDPDMLLISKYSAGSNRGDIFLLENLWGNNFSVQDSTYAPFGKAWYKGLAELPSTERNQRSYYTYRAWAKDETIQISENGQSFQISDSLFLNSDTSNTHGIALGDYDNDGDMDLFKVSTDRGLQLFRNQEGVYQNHSDSMFNQLGGVILFPLHVNLADFNNDGYLDIFLSHSTQSRMNNTILLNVNGSSFHEAGPVSGIQSPGVLGSCIGDLEGDGDIDIFGFRRGANLLWINDHDQNDFITINQTGSGSYRDNNSAFALYYEPGKSGEPSALLGRRQSRLGSSYPLAINASSIHFGMGDRTAVDIIAYNGHGQVTTFHNIAAGTVLTLQTDRGIQGYYYFLERELKRIVNTPRIAIGLLAFLVNILTQFYFAYFMKQKFNWRDIHIHMSGTLNLVIFMSIFYLSDFGSVWVTFTLPLLISQSGNLIVLLGYVLYQKISALYTHSPGTSHLLQQVMIFSHGEWALKNVNGLILYFQNYETASNSALNQRARERTKIFLDLTIPAIRDLIGNCDQASFPNSSPQEVSSDIGVLETEMELIQRNWDQWTGDAQVFADRLTALLNTIRNLKHDIYAKYSSTPFKILNQLIKSMEDEFDQHDVTVEVIAEDQYEQRALIKKNDLIAILENCFRNAISAMQDQERKILRVRLFEFAPRLRIQISDTGVGISDSHREKIFNPGFSDSGSSGLGLFQAKEILHHYAGSIQLESELDHNMTTFTIDLHKGV